MLAQTNSTPDEHICSLAAYMHVHMHAYAPVLAHPYYPMHTVQYVQYDHSICNHTIIHHTYRMTPVNVIIQSPQARKPLDRMCVHAGDGQTYLVRADSMS